MRTSTSRGKSTRRRLAIATVVALAAAGVVFGCLLAQRKPALADAARSPDLLIARFLDALAAKDRAVLHRLRVSKEEYLAVILPGSVPPGSALQLWKPEEWSLQGVLGPGGRKFVAERGKELLEDALPTFRVPVAVAQKLKVPALDDGPVVLDSLHVPFDLDVERVLAVGGNLWVTLDAQVGAVVGGEEGIGVSVKTKKKAKRT